MQNLRKLALTDKICTNQIFKDREITISDCLRDSAGSSEDVHLTNRLSVAHRFVGHQRYSTGKGTASDE